MDAPGLNVTVLELPARWGSAAPALVDIERRLGEGPAGDLLLLPEAGLTGYVSPDGNFDARRAAEPLDGPIAHALAGLALRHRVHVIGPLVESDGDRWFNAMLGFAPDGSRFLHYRKRHPWLPETWATPGTGPYPLIRIGPLLVTIATCYDVHFLAAEAGDRLGAADLLLFPSAWVDRHDTRPGLMYELAREYDVAIANANWGPGVVRVPGQGGSCILAAGGEVLATAPLGGRADAWVGVAPT